MANEDVIKGLVLGVAAAVAIPLLLKSSRGQAVGKALLRAGEVFAEKAQDFAVELSEIAEDTLAEWQHAEMAKGDGESASPPVADSEKHTA